MCMHMLMCLPVNGQDVTTLSPALPRPAATTIVVRERDHQLEVLMVRRSLQASFMPGSYVFPGGAVDVADASAEAALCCDETAEQACRRLRASESSLAFAVAALRECFEESGLWLGVQPAPDARALQAARLRLRAGDGLASLARALGMPLATGALWPFSHWVTPIDAPRRFDTRFFVAVAPEDHTPSADEAETTSLCWVRPAGALARAAQGDFPLEFATRHNLQALAAFGEVAALLAHVQGGREIVTVHPRVAIGAGGERRVLLPTDHAYAEVCRVDPGGSGSAQCVIEAGQLVQLAPTLARLTAPNAGMMTGPGTNSYLVGRDGEFAVIDPGPLIESHLEVLMQATRGRIVAVLVTHTHVDHSPAAMRLAALARAPCIGLPAPANGRQDRSFEPDRQPADGEEIHLAGCTLRAIHTPGHASNHVCWWFEEEHLLFTGDHLMQGSTVVIDPPDGDMAAYLASLRKLPELLPSLAWLAPGHGFLVDRPREAIDRLIAHRLAREAKLLAAMQGLGPSDVPALLAVVYDDVAPPLYPVAARSLLAHLRKLQSEGLAVERDGRYRRA